VNEKGEAQDEGKFKLRRVKNPKRGKIKSKNVSGVILGRTRRRKIITWGWD
jgi:hypothetical protein